MCLHCLGSFCREENVEAPVLGWGGGRKGEGTMLPLEKAWEAKLCMSHSCVT